MNLQRRTLLTGLAAGAATSIAPWAHAQGYPELPVKWVVPYPAGGGTDVIARALAQEMAKDLGGSVIIENRPGAGTIIGTQAVATSAPARLVS